MTALDCVIHIRGALLFELAHRPGSTEDVAERLQERGFHFTFKPAARWFRLLEEDGLVEPSDPAWQWCLTATGRERVAVIRAALNSLTQEAPDEAHR